MRVNAYAAPAAGQPLAPTTIERREVGAHDVLIAIEYAGICHSDIHTVNGDWGPQPFPVVPGHEIVGTVPRSAPTSPTTRSATASASAAWSTRAASAPTAATATSSTASTAWSAPTPSPTSTAPPPRAATPRTSSSTPTSCSPSRRASTRPPLRRCCAPASRRTPRCVAGSAGPGKQGRRRRARRPRPHGRQDRPRHGRRGHRALAVAEEAGGRPAARGRPLLRHLRPRHVRALAGSFDLIVNTVSASIDVNAYLGLLAVDGTLVNVGAPPEPLPVNAMSLIGGRRSFAGLDDRRHRRDPGDARLLRRARHRRPRSR